MCGRSYSGIYYFHVNSICDNDLLFLGHDYVPTGSVFMKTFLEGRTF